MNRHSSTISRALLIAICLTVSVSGPRAQQAKQESPAWFTNDRAFVIENITSHSIKGLGANIEVNFKGTPLLGQIKPQSIKFQCNSLIASLKQNPAKAYYLSTGDLSGDVVIRQLPSSGEATTLTTSRATFTESPNQKEATITLPSPFTLDQGPNQKINAASGRVDLKNDPNLIRAETGKPAAPTDRTWTKATLNGTFNLATSTSDSASTTKTTLSGTGLTVTRTTTSINYTTGSALKFYQAQTPKTNAKPLTIDFKSSGGTVTTPFNSSPNTRPIQSADLKGRVITLIDTFARDPETKEFIPLKIRAEGDRLQFNPEGIMTLTGNIKLTLNEGQGIYGTGDVLTITFDQEMNVKSWETRGGPARIEADPPVKKDGGGGK